MATELKILTFGARAPWVRRPARPLAAPPSQSDLLGLECLRLALSCMMLGPAVNRRFLSLGGPGRSPQRGVWGAKASR